VVLDDVSGIVSEFEAGKVVHTGDDLASGDYLAALRDVPALEAPARALAGNGTRESPAALAAAVELILEGLHLTKRLNKDARGPRALYRSRR